MYLIEATRASHLEGVVVLVLVKDLSFVVFDTSNKNKRKVATFRVSRNDHVARFDSQIKHISIVRDSVLESSREVCLFSPRIPILGE